MGDNLTNMTEDVRSCYNASARMMLLNASAGSPVTDIAPCVKSETLGNIRLPFEQFPEH
jgi:hypothetical protein